MDDEKSEVWIWDDAAAEETSGMEAQRKAVNDLMRGAGTVSVDEAVTVKLKTGVCWSQTPAINKTFDKSQKSTSRHADMLTCGSIVASGRDLPPLSV